MIQILVARYKEPSWMVRRLLDSVAFQQGFDLSDVSVIVCNDGDYVLPEETFDGYPFEVTYVVMPHRGVSATRNTLLDMSYGEYLMFCDADDCFHDMVGLNVVGEAMRGGFDVFVPAFLEETSDFRYMTRSRDPFFLHGKVFRRAYLMECDIRWDDSFVTSGDNYFLWQSLSLTEDIVYSPTSYYVWKHNPNSVCRVEDDHFLKDYPKHVRTYRLLCGNFLGREREDLATRFACLMVYDAFMFLRLWCGDVSKDDSMAELRAACEEFGWLFMEASALDRFDAYREKAANFGLQPSESDMEDAERWVDATFGSVMQGG